jgi:hypothetical protein
MLTPKLITSLFATAAASLLLSGLAGCAGRTEWLDNDDPALRKKPAEFAATAASLQPFKADLPPGGEAAARAQVDYGWDVLQVVNLSGVEWTDVQVWVNREYVVLLPKMEPNVLKRINFRMIYNGTGQNFPTNNMKTQINQLEIVRDGKLYSVPLRLRD